METFLKVWLAPMWNVLVTEEFVVLFRVFYHSTDRWIKIVRHLWTGFEHDVQGVKDKKQKKLPSHCFYKRKKNITKMSSVYFVNQPLHVSSIFVAQLFSWLSVGWSTVSQLKSTTRTNCCIYTVYLLMMGCRYAQNMYRLIDEINWG
jgi:hypothetical protein